MRDCAKKLPYIDDAGFTAQVMQKLPAPQAERLSSAGSFCITLTLSRAV